jgi:hypothetical protein
MPFPSRLADLRHLDKIAKTLQDPRYRFPRRSFLIGAGATALIAGTGLTFMRFRASAAFGATMSIVAHENDDLLFLNPDILHDIQAGRAVRTVYLTAGDDGVASTFWQNRQIGEQLAYSEMTSVANSWTQADAGISGHPIPIYTLAAFPAVSIVFMHLPDGNLDGSGFPSDGFQSLQKLWQGAIPSIHAIDGSSSYSLQDLKNTLASLMSNFQADQIYTQDYTGTYGDGDHSDHHTVGYLVQAAAQQYTATFSLTGYQGYGISQKPANVTGADRTAKQNAFYAYGQAGTAVCNSTVSCGTGGYAQWLERRYTISAVPSPDIALQAMATASSQNSGAGQTANKAIDGVINGYPGDHTKEWATSGGKAGSWLKLTWPSPQTVSMVVLYDRPNLNDQITAGNIQFSDGSSIPVGPLNNDGSATAYTFAPRTITSLQLNITGVSATTRNVGLAEIQVYGTFIYSADVALLSTATASSQNSSSGQTANKAIDGVVDGYPGDHTKEWATSGGGVGSWLKLTWPSPQKVNMVVLYDRPNLNDQITAGNIQFSDGSSLTIGPLNNDGSPAGYTFPAKTISSLQLNVTGVSSTTRNVGLAEIQVYGNTTTGGDVALQAMATASSQNSGAGQTANKAIDGVINGYPGDHTKEWATSGGKAGSWLKLSWPSPQTVNRLVLYDRPNRNDQITAGNVQFSDGSSIPIGPLNNDGTPTTYLFAARTITSLQLNVTGVSSTTRNVGLAEIQVFGPGIGGGSTPPMANAGASQTVPGGSTVTLDGSGSTDLNGKSLTYQWTQTGGSPTVTLSSATAVQPTFVAPTAAANLTFQLVVNDGQNTSQPATVTVVVIALPIANAGPDQTVAVGSSVTLDGSGSTDSNSNPLTYLWTQTSGSPTVTLSDSTVEQPTFVAPTSATILTFQLVVNDGQNNSEPATVTIRVDDLPVAAIKNPNPQTVNVGDTVILDGSGSTDPNGKSLTYLWTQTSGSPTVTLSDATAVQPTFVAPSGDPTLVFQLIVNDGLFSSQPATVTITVTG